MCSWRKKRFSCISWVKVIILATRPLGIPSLQRRPRLIKLLADFSCSFFDFLMFSTIKSNTIFLEVLHFSYDEHSKFRHFWLCVFLEMSSHWSKRSLIDFFQSSSDNLLHAWAPRHFIISLILMQLLLHVVRKSG